MRQWTGCAQWFSVWKAYSRAQLHKRLVEIAHAYGGRISVSIADMAAFTFVSAISSLLARMREITRSTFPSTAGTGSPKAMEAMAPAV